MQRPDVSRTAASGKKHERLPVRRPARLVVAAGASRELPQLAGGPQPQIHRSATIGIERDLRPIWRPRTSAVFAGAGNHRFRFAGRGACGWIDRQPPDVGVLRQDREDDLAGAGRHVGFDVLPRAGGELLHWSDRFPIDVDGNAPQIQAATAI